MTVPKTMREILANAESLVQTFEHYEPEAENVRDVAPLHALLKALRQGADAESAMESAVAGMRGARWSWASIGGVLGMSGEEARERYGAAAAGVPTTGSIPVQRPPAAAPSTGPSPTGAAPTGELQQ